MPEKGTQSIQRLLRAIRSYFFRTKLYERLGQTLAASILKKKANKCKSINDIVELSFDIFGNSPIKYFKWSIRPGQVKEEITSLLEILAKRRPKVILEIGTANGGTLFLFAKVSDPDSLIVSVDMPRPISSKHRFGGGYPEWRIPFYRSFATQNQKILLIRKDSHASSTLSTLKTALEESKLDFLFIDGDHTYKGAKMDFEMYSKLVGRGGMIAFHDICPHPPETGFGCEVNKLWCEIRERYAHDEIIKDSKQGWAGIGVVYME